MPRKQRTIIEETLPDKPETLLDENLVEDDVLSGVLDEFGDNPYKIKVYKIDGGKRSFCFESADRITESQVQTQYPQGGSFAVCVFTNTNNRLFKTFYWNIEPKPLSLTPTNGHQSNGDNIQVRMLMDELQFSRQMVLTMLSKAQNTTQPSIVEILQLMQGMPERKDPADILIKGLEMGAKINGGASGDWKGDLINALKDVAVPAMETFNNISKQRNPIPVQLTTEQRQLALPEDTLKKGLDWLKNRIMVGLPPELAVEWLANNADDPEYQPFINKAINSTIDDFITLDPDLAKEPYKTWFTKTIQMLKEEYEHATQNDDSDDSDSVGGNGDITNTENDAKTSIRKPKQSKAV